MIIVKVASKYALVNPQLDEKLMQLASQGHVVRYSDQGFGIAQVRNRALNRFLYEDRESHLLMIDSDMIWLDETDEILKHLETEVAYAQYIDKTGGLAHNGALGCACLRVSRTAIKKIAPPWFQFTYDQDDCADVACECSFFAQKARDAGFYPTSLGSIGHIIPFVAAVNAAGKARLSPLSLWNQGLT